MIQNGTLAEAVSSHLKNNDEFRYHLASFLDRFYLERDSLKRRAKLIDEPPLSGNQQFDALIGAIGEHLCMRWSLGRAPDWVDHPDRFLKRPLFMGEETMKAFYMAESPAAYRRRFIFTELEPLRRARMPKDEMWWYGEQIRTGMTPLPDEIERSFDTPILEESGATSHRL